MYKGNREQVFLKAKRPILEMWVEGDCLVNNIMGPGHGLGAQMPKLVRTGRGRTALTEKDPHTLMRDGYSAYMYHVDLGRVYVLPNPLNLDDLANVECPPNFDSVMVKTIVNDTISREVRLNSQQEDTNDIYVDDSDEELKVPPLSYAKHYLVFDDARISLAYRIDFHLDDSSPVKFNISKS